MNTTTKKKRFTTRDVMVIAAMMVLTFAVYGAVGALTLPFPFLYLYCSAGIQEFFCATFYLVVANRLNKHGILMVWSTVFGIISALGGYAFLLPYFLLVGVICELAMLGKDSYRGTESYIQVEDEAVQQAVFDKFLQLVNEGSGDEE